MSSVRYHIVAILGAIVVAIGLLMPHIYFALELDSEYRGIHIMETDAEVHYLARIQSAHEGYGLGNPFFYEEMDDVPPPGYVLSEKILALPLRVVDLTVSDLSLVYTAVFPPILFLLIYGLAFRLTRSRTAGLGAAALTVFGTELFSIVGLTNLLSWSYVYDQFTTYARPVNPQFSSLLFFALLHTLLTLWDRKREGAATLWYAAVALLYGFSFYVYFYSWTFFTVLLGIFLLYFARYKYWLSFKRLFVAFCAGGILGLPYFYSLYQFGVHPYYADISKTFGIVSSHMPIFSLAGILIGVLYLSYAVYTKRVRSKLDPNLVFLGLVLICTYIVINQQIITGTLIQEGHYHWYFNIPTFAFVLIFVGSRILRNRPKVNGLCISGLIVASVSIFTLMQISSYMFWSERYEEYQTYMTPIEWLNENGVAGEVVLSDGPLSEFLSIYTNLFSYWNLYGFTYLTPRDRVMHALFTYLYLYDITPKSMPEEAFHPPTDIGLHTHKHPELRALLGSQKDYLIDFYPEGMSDLYQAVYSQPLNKHLASPYKIDYIILTRKSGATWLDHLNYPIVYEGENFIIYTYE